MRSWSIPLGRIFGIEIRVHLTFLFLLVFVWGTEAATQDSSAALRGLALVGIVFGSVVLHEMGHALVARGSGILAKGIILLPIGGITILDEAHAIPDPLNAWKRDIRIAVAGPLVNLFIAGLSALILLAAIPGFSLTTRPLLHSSALLRSIVWANLYLGLFNLLPAYPMDGGRVLRALFMRRGDMIHATQRAVRIGHVHDGRNSPRQLVAGHDRILPLRRRTTRRALSGVSIRIAECPSGRSHAHRLRNALAR